MLRFDYFFAHRNSVSPGYTSFRTVAVQKAKDSLENASVGDYVRIAKIDPQSKHCAWSGTCLYEVVKTETGVSVNEKKGTSSL